MKQYAASLTQPVSQPSSYGKSLRSSKEVKRLGKRLGRSICSSAAGCCIFVLGGAGCMQEDSRHDRELRDIDDKSE
jgi:hypothetical protein